MTTEWIDRLPVPQTGDEMRTLWTKLATVNWDYPGVWERYTQLRIAILEGLPGILNQLEEAQDLVARMRQHEQEMLAEQERLEEDAYNRGRENALNAAEDCW